MADELDRILGESENEDSTESPTVENASEEGKKEKSDDQKLTEKATQLASLQVAIQKEEDRLHRVREERKAASKPEPKVNPVEPQEDLSSPEGWKSHIAKQSQSAVEPLRAELDRHKLAQLDKARVNFIRRHPEYSDEAKMEKLEGTYHRLAQRGDMDFDLILEDFEDAWAVDNRSEILKKEAALRKSRLDAEDELHESASMGGGTGASDKEGAVKASAEDYRIAKQTGKDIKEYLKLKKQLEESTFS